MALHVYAEYDHIVSMVDRDDVVQNLYLESPYHARVVCDLVKLSFYVQNPECVPKLLLTRQILYVIIQIKSIKGAYWGFSFPVVCMFVCM